MSDSRIPNQIDSIADRRFFGCAAKFTFVFVVCLAVFATVLRSTDDKGVRVSAAFAASGLALGFATSILAAGSRKLLVRVFVLFPLVLSLIMFASRTLLDMSDRFPLRLVVAPLFITAGFLIGQIRRRSQF